MVKTASLIALLLVTASAGATNFEELRQCSSGKVKALKIFHVGQAALYRQDCAADDKLAPPMRLAFGYNREVPGDAFAKAARKMIERNLSEDRFEKLSSRINAFNSHYRTTHDGDRYTLDYDADQSLVLSLNGEVLAREQGRDFADAYLSIWFGDDPYSDDLKAELLSGGS